MSVDSNGLCTERAGASSAAMVLAAAAKGQTSMLSWSGACPPCPDVPECSDMSMPDISVLLMSMPDMSLGMLMIMGPCPVHRTSPPGPGMKPGGISRRLPSATSSSAASHGFLAQRIATWFLTSEAYPKCAPASMGKSR